MLTRRTFLTASATLPVAGFLSTPVWAAKSPVYATDGVAINGFDPVAYFTEGAPVKGLSEFASDWQGASVLFASAENKAMFDADVEAFAPRYGGYCAYAVSKGGIATTDPEAWTVHENRLYLNFSLDVRSIWKEDIPGNVARADANWPGVLSA